MESRYGLIRQGSGVWRAFRDGDFEEEDVWEVLKDRKNSSNHSMVGRSNYKESSLPRHLPTAKRMIPKLGCHNYGSGSSCSSTNTTHEPKIVQQSAPVNIPDWSKSYGATQKSKKGTKIVSWQKNEYYDDADDDDDDDGDEDGDSEEYEEEEEYAAKVLGEL